MMPNKPLESDALELGSLCAAELSRRVPLRKRHEA